MKEKVRFSHSKIKEIKYTFNLGEERFVSADTERINGELKSILVDIGEIKNLRFKVFSKTYPFVTIIDATLTESKAFYPVIHHEGPKGTDYVIPSRSEYSLNEKLTMELEGPTNGIIKVVVRFG